MTAARPPARVDPAAVRRVVGRGAVVLGLAVIWIAFQVANDNFLSARNLSNLVLQTAVLATLSIGMVVVLILGEIDLSVGAIAGVVACTLASLLTGVGVPAAVAIVIALAVGGAIGLLHGTVITAVGIPSFIVTLAGLLVWQGVQLAIAGSGGQIPITDPFVQAIASTYAAAPIGWTLAAFACVALVVARLLRRHRRVRSGLRVESLPRDLLVPMCTGALILAITALLNSYYGVPWVLVIVLALVAGFSVLLRDTPFGRHVYAIGGNREAARRAGIRVRTVTVVVFVVISVTAGIAGILEASREFSATNALGGGTLQLNAIAAAVIGGTSLFGGRGRVVHALLGSLVVGSVQNGLDLLGQTAAVKNVATGVILVIAVSVDAVARRRRQQTGAAE